MTRKEREEIVWLAAFFTGEGTIGIYHSRKQHSWRCGLAVANTDSEIIYGLQKVIGGAVYLSKPSNPRSHMAYILCWNGRKAERVARRIHPFLRGKKKEQCAEFLDAMNRWPHGKINGKQLSPETIQLRMQLANSVNKYNSQRGKRRIYSILSQAPDAVNEANDGEGATTICEPRKG